MRIIPFIGENAWIRQYFMRKILQPNMQYNMRYNIKKHMTNAHCRNVERV